MLIALLAYLGGMLTIVSPCILPVLPFVFANAGRNFKRGAVPMLVGMALTFAVVATLAAVGGSWAVRANEAGRWVALVLLALFGLALVFPAISDRATRPISAFRSTMTELSPMSRVGRAPGMGKRLSLVVVAICVIVLCCCAFCGFGRCPCAWGTVLRVPVSRWWQQMLAG